jgi:GDP-L-fucose synthase
MRILLTGATGMVGRNILEHQHASRHEWLSPGSRELDLCNAAAVTAYIAEARPDFIIHCAGKVGGIHANIREPVEFMLRNFDMGRNVVVAARAARVLRLLNLGSSCMYPRNCLDHLHEDMVLGGELEPTNEGYALAKIGVSRLCRYIAAEDSRFRYKTLIPCNLYGRWDKFDPAHSHLIPAVIRKLHAAKTTGVATIDIWGDGTARREFMYSADLADCIHRALENQHFDSLPDLMNVGPGDDHSIDDYYRSIASVVGYRGSFWHDTSRPVGMKRKLVAIDRQAAWGWQPDTKLEEGVRRTYAFFLEQENS